MRTTSPYERPPGPGAAPPQIPAPLDRPYRIAERTSTNDTQLLQPAPSFVRAPGAAGIDGPPLLAPNAGDAADEPPSAAPSLPLRGGSSNENFNTSPARVVGSPRASGGPTKPPRRSHPPAPLPARGINPASEINARLDAQVEVRVYPCNGGATGSNKKKLTKFHVKPEGVIIQGANRHRAPHLDLGNEYAAHIGRRLQRYELSDARASQLLVTTHDRTFWVVPAPEAFSRHSGTCRLLGDRKHAPAAHSLKVGDFLRVGSVGVVVIETHDGRECRVLSEEKIQRIVRDTTNQGGGFLDLAETDGENSDDSSVEGEGASSRANASGSHSGGHNDVPTCYMCFDDEDTPENPMITPCKCLGDTRYVHVDCLRRWHTAEADNQICFLSSVDATCSVCKTTFRSDFKLKDGRRVKLFKSSLEPPYISLLVATKHEMAQRLFNTRFQLSFSTLLKNDGWNGTRPLFLGRSSTSDMVLDYRTVSARHATVRFKNGEFIFTDAGSSNGSYLYLRRPVELSSSQSVQFRLGRSMISMKVVSKWNRRLLRAVSRRVGASGGGPSGRGPASCGGMADDRSVGSNEDDVRVTDREGRFARAPPRRTREGILAGMPPVGMLSQSSPRHLDLLRALAYPDKMAAGSTKEAPKLTKVSPVQVGTMNFGEDSAYCEDEAGGDRDIPEQGQDGVEQQEEMPEVEEGTPSTGLDILGGVNDIDIGDHDREQH